MVLKCHQSSIPYCRGEVLTAQCMADACGRPLQACFMKHKRVDWLCAQAWQSICSHQYPGQEKPSAPAEHLQLRVYVLLLWCLSGTHGSRVGHLNKNPAQLGELIKTEEWCGDVVAGTLETLLRLRPSSMAHPDSLAATLKLLPDMSCTVWRTSLG